MPRDVFAETGFTPDAMNELTPYAFAALFLNAPVEGDSVTAMGPTTEAVIEWNRRYASTKGFYIPAWFLKHLKR